MAEITRFNGLSAACVRSWSKHELTQLNRAISFLASQGLVIECDYGLTDEGDPWFVYCDAESDDVIAHFAKIAGTYVACLPFRKNALQGILLEDVINRFLQRQAGARLRGPRPRGAPNGHRPNRVA